ncbi:MAG: hypothetical protein HC913_07610 [Microscillaceae bacterium]|nr:hypothetical protein [Microscillaceae bacterium]
MASHPSPMLNDEELHQLLEQGQFESILVNCQQYIESKVERYLKNFKYYQQFQHDFYHEVCIHVLTKSLPSAAFLEAVRNGTSFTLYLAKTVRNTLNTLLSREKNKRQNVIGITQCCAGVEEEDFSEDKLGIFSDASYHHQTDSQDLLAKIKERFRHFLQNFEKVFPRLYPKLLLLLKLQARAEVSIQDLKSCFPGIKPKDLRRFGEMLGHRAAYLHREDQEIYQLICPFFQHYRSEKGNATALQRWLNQHISGDKFSQGILDRLEIKESQANFRITDKKLFADFVHLYFKEQASGEILVPIAETFAPVPHNPVPAWVAIANNGY